MAKQQRTKETALLKTAIEAFTASTGASVKILDIKETDGGDDAMIQVRFRSVQQQFKVEVKGELRGHLLSNILSQFGKDKDKWLLVSRYIPGPLKENFKKNGINYLEATGNCYINTGNIYLYINEREVKQVRKTKDGKLWKASGLKLLFILIQDPVLITATYRQLSELAGIALGSITSLFEELREEGYIQKDDHTGKEALFHRNRLIENWAELYPTVLRPKLSMGVYRFLNDQQTDAWKVMEPEEVYWSGDPAGDLYTHHLIPETFILYTRRPANELIKLLKIIPDKGGKVMLYQKFWQDWPGSRHIGMAVPPLLAYADLKSGEDSRSWEIAEKIKTNFLDEQPIS